MWETATHHATTFTVTLLQCQTFDACVKGKDVIGRARTGMGKTLAFVIPVVERIIAAGGIAKTRGRTPKVLVMAPTRELAKQVGQDFELTAVGMTTLCVYGGTSLEPQVHA